jgi:hypothetical protein
VITRTSAQPLSAAASLLHRVLVPLSGDGPIFHYLLDAGHHVTCIELVEKPIQLLLQRYETERAMQKQEVKDVGANVWTAKDASFVIYQVRTGSTSSKQQAAAHTLIHICSILLCVCVVCADS